MIVTMSLAHSPPPAARLQISSLLNSNRMDTSDFTPVTGQCNKRPRAGTPPQDGIRLIDKVSKDMIETRNKIGAAVLNIKTTSLKELAGSVNTFFNNIIVKALERQASTMSDIAGTITSQNDIIRELG